MAFMCTHRCSAKGCHLPVSNIFLSLMYSSVMQIKSWRIPIKVPESFAKVLPLSLKTSGKNRQNAILCPDNGKNIFICFQN